MTLAIFAAIVMIEPGWSGPFPLPPTPPPMVQIIYAIPSDRDHNPHYEDAIRDAILHVQGWYAQQLDGSTFVVSTPTPLVCDVAHPADYYEGLHGWGRVVESVQHCAPVEHWSDRYVWAIYIDAEFDCDGDGELGGATRGTRRRPCWGPERTP